jgi:hypothetical protein
LDGNPLAKMASSVACSSNLDSPNEHISSTTQLLNTSACDVFDATSSALALSSELSDQNVFDALLSNDEPSDRPAFAPESAGLTAPLSNLQNSIEPTEGSSLQQNSAASSDPSKWTSDDVKRLFSSKIGSCSEEAYEKLKLCALGVLCHWDNNLGKMPALLLSPKLLLFLAK